MMDSFAAVLMTLGAAVLMTLGRSSMYKFSVAGQEG
jgi:hypothetical protein